MTVLLRLKTLKEEQALRDLQTRRRRVSEGEADLTRARAAVAESVATLSFREDAIYQEIIGGVVDTSILDDTRSAVVLLQQDHALLEDAATRAEHVLMRLTADAEEATARHQATLRVRDKYILLRDDMRSQAQVAADQAEEGEVEETFVVSGRALA